MTTRDAAYEIAAGMGFEGDVFSSEQDSDIGRVDQVKVRVEDEAGVVTFWHAEVSEANGCEMFSAWDAESQAFYVERVAARKATKKSRRKVAKV